MARPVCSDRNAASASANALTPSLPPGRGGAPRVRVDEMVELQPVCLGIAFEKEGQRLVADDPLSAGKGDRAQGDVVGSESPVRPEDLDALVVATSRCSLMRVERASDARR